MLYIRLNAMDTEHVGNVRYVIVKTVTLVHIVINAL